MTSVPRIAITSGDPAGIGPEVVLKALARTPLRNARLVVIGDYAVFERTARRLRRRLPRWRVVDQPGAVRSQHRLAFLDCGRHVPFRPGRASAQTGRASLVYVDCAVELWRAKAIQALVTAPVAKWAIAVSRRDFVGHTEYLARAMEARDVAMMFVSDQLRVVLLTRHLPLRRVASAIDQTLLRATLRLTNQGLQDLFTIARPRIAVCGLNPHAGEEARCGTEERLVMAPVLRALRRQGIRCDGPLSADGLFGGRAEIYDAVVCAYHDQGLIPFKAAARDRGCQLTLGLPIVRTSPDHGSALDIAGRGIAHPGSMLYALELAARLAHQQHR